MRSFHTHSAPYRCATVSRTELKLDPRLRVNCSLVSEEHASSVRRSAHKLYWNRKRSSSGVTIAVLLRKVCGSHTAENIVSPSFAPPVKNMARTLAASRHRRGMPLITQMVRFGVGRELSLLNVAAIFPCGAGDQFAHFRVVPREFRLVAEAHPQQVVNHQNLSVAIRPRANANRGNSQLCRDSRRKLA